MAQPYDWSNFPRLSANAEAAAIATLRRLGGLPTSGPSMVAGPGASSTPSVNYGAFEAPPEAPVNYAVTTTVGGVPVRVVHRVAPKGQYDDTPNILHHYVTLYTVPTDASSRKRRAETELEGGGTKKQQTAAGTGVATGGNTLISLEPAELVEELQEDEDGEYEGDPVDDSNGGEKIGHASQQIILRDAMRQSGTFAEEMDENGGETEAMLDEAFTQEGRVDAKAVTDAYWKGTGVFGQELSTGGVVYISRLRIEPKFRKQGFGRVLLNQVLKSSKVVESCDFALVHPVALQNQEPAELWEEQRRIAEHFYRARGFRRFGRTVYLALALKDAHHPALQLPEASDIPSLYDEKQVYLAKFDADELARPDGVPPYTMESEETSWYIAIIQDPGQPRVGFAPREQHNAKLRVRFPIHWAILEDNDEASVKSLIEAKAAIDLKLLRERTRDGTTPLHQAALKSTPAVIRALFVANADAVDDLNVRDVEGRRPIDILSARMVQDRDQAWGAPAAKVTEVDCETLYLLKQYMQLPLPPPSDLAKPWLALMETIDSCSCSQCINGVSPKMKIRITGAAGMFDDFLREEEWDMKGDRTKSVELMMGGNYMPPRVRRVDKTFLRGFAAYLKAIGKLVEKDEGVNPPAVESEILHHARNDEYSAASSFRENGGSAEVALNAMLCMVQDNLRDMTRDDPEYDEGLCDIVCDQDDDFAGVRQRWKIPALYNGPIQWAPWDSFPSAA